MAFLAFLASVEIGFLFFPKTLQRVGRSTVHATTGATTTYATISTAASASSSKICRHLKIKPPDITVSRKSNYEHGCYFRIQLRRAKMHASNLLVVKVRAEYHEPEFYDGEKLLDVAAINLLVKGNMGLVPIFYDGESKIYGVGV
jgi:hypothetical protein